MKSSSKLLPHLNQLFLRRQSYLSHLTNICRIRDKRLIPSGSTDRLISTHTSSRSSRLKSNEIQSKALKTKLPDPIIERSRSVSKTMAWMSPFRRRKQIERVKQNQRMKQKISQLKSDVRRDRLSADYSRILSIKERIMKYEVNPESHKSVLKCERSLNISISRVTLKENENKVKINSINPSGKILANHLLLNKERCRQKVNYTEHKRYQTEQDEKRSNNTKVTLRNKMKKLVNFPKIAELRNQKRKGRGGGFNRDSFGLTEVCLD